MLKDSILSLALISVVLFSNPSMAGKNILAEDLKAIKEWGEPLSDMDNPLPAVAFNGVGECGVALAEPYPSKFKIQERDLYDDFTFISEFAIDSILATQALIKGICLSTLSTKQASIEFLQIARKSFEQAFVSYSMKADLATERLRNEGESLGALSAILGNFLASKKQTGAAILGKGLINITLESQRASLQREITFIKNIPNASKDTIRIPVVPLSGFLKLIVRVVSNAGRCTGSFVGPRLVLTNAHCVTDKNGKAVTGLRVSRDYLFATEDFSVKNWWTVSGEGGLWDQKFTDDWALIELNENRFDSDQFFRVPNSIMDKEFTNLILMVAGYSGDINQGRFLTMDIGCLPKELTAEKLYYDCSTYKGSSGAPILSSQDVGTIVALNACSAREQKNTATERGLKCGVRVERFFDKVNELLLRDGVNQGLIALRDSRNMRFTKITKARSHLETIKMPDWTK